MPFPLSVCFFDRRAVSEISKRAAGDKRAVEAMTTLYSDFNSRDDLKWAFDTLNTSRYISFPTGALSSVNSVSFCRSWKSGY